MDILTISEEKYQFRFFKELGKYQDQTKLKNVKYHTRLLYVYSENYKKNNLD